MITVNDAPMIGASTKRGLYQSGAHSIGKASSAAITQIDFTSPILDSRIIYKCASKHAYWNNAGAIEFADIDEYPLEYDPATLLPIGRHEPEPSSTNFAQNSAGNWTGGGYVFSFSEYSPGVLLATATAGATPSGVFFRHSMAIQSGKNYTASFIADYSNNAGGARPYGSSSQSYTGASQYVANKLNRAGATFSHYVSEPVAYAATVNAGITVTPIRRADSAVVVNELKMALVQVELGSICTSPINTIDAAVTREQSTLHVSLQGKTAITVYYSIRRQLLLPVRVNYSGRLRIVA